jgi:hypothetical protein
MFFFLETDFIYKLSLCFLSSFFEPSFSCFYMYKFLTNIPHRTQLLKHCFLFRQPALACLVPRSEPPNHHHVPNGTPCAHPTVPGAPSSVMAEAFISLFIPAPINIHIMTRTFICCGSNNGKSEISLIESIDIKNNSVAV